MAFFKKIIDNGKRRYVFELSASALISLVGSIFVCLIWSFILGIILGRGHNPEEQLPQLAGIMPQATNDTTVAPRIVEKNAQGIMRVEELQFRDDLRDGQLVNNSQNVAKPVKPTQVASNVKPPAIPSTIPPTIPQEPKKTSQSVSSAEQASKTAQEEAKKKQQLDALKQAAVQQALTQMEEKKNTVNNKKTEITDKPVVTKADNSEPRFRYVYQVAASRDEKQADIALKQISSVGIKARLERQDGWIKILVDFVGTPDDTQKLKDALAKIKITRIIMRDKKSLE